MKRIKYVSLLYFKEIAKTLKMMPFVRNIKVLDTAANMYLGCLQIARNHAIYVDLITTYLCV